jgi:hypothetical protein
VSDMQEAYSGARSVHPTTWAVGGGTVWVSCCDVCFGYCKNVLSVAVDTVGERMHESRVSGRGFFSRC